jgi:exosortase A-associated hydrolase 1
MSERTLSIPCEGTAMFGILHEPDAAMQNLGVVIVVGGPQYRVGSHRQFVLIARALCKAGYSVLRFDFRGMGDSAGDFAGFQGVGADIAAAIDAICMHSPPVQRVVLWGLCDAASACSMFVRKGHPRVAGLVLVNPEVRTEVAFASTYLRHYYWGRIWQKSFWSKVLKMQFDVRSSARGLLDTISKATRRGSEVGASSELPDDYVSSMLSGLTDFSGPALVLLSGKDLTARAFEDLLDQNPAWGALMLKRGFALKALPGADHTFSRLEDLQASVYELQNWLNTTVKDA